MTTRGTRRTALSRSALLFSSVLAATLGATLAAGCGKPSVPKPDRKAVLEQTLKQGGRVEVAAAAKEYREMLGESPDALRTIADAHLRLSDEESELAVTRPPMFL